jgi:hypothetical protein
MIIFSCYDVFFRKNDQQDVDNSQSNFSSLLMEILLTAQTRLLHFKIKHQFHSIKVWIYFIRKTPKYLGNWSAAIRGWRSLYNPYLSVNPYQNSKIKWSKRCFCKWNSLYWAVSICKKHKVDAKADYYYKSLTKVYWM